MQTLPKFLFYFFFSIILASCGSKNEQAANESKNNEKTLPVAYEPSFFEMRTYYCHPGKLPNLLTRFSDHTMDLFEKHGMVNMGYWLPIDNEDNKLVYLMGYQDLSQRDEAWKTFMNDPEWIEVWDKSKANGPIVDSVVSTYMTYTDYSPKLEAHDGGPRIFSLRTYFTNDGKLNDLHARFKNHTLEIFKNNGMKNIAYFNLDESNQGADRILTYLISFPDTAARKTSWESFGHDPAWRSAYQNSIKDGKLVDSIAAELMVPTEFSPLK